MTPIESLDELVRGNHEQCAWCKAPFAFTDGKMQRVRGLDGKYYCDQTHASAPYITEKWNGRVSFLRR